MLHRSEECLRIWHIAVAMPQDARVVAESFSPTGVGDPTLVNHFAIAQKRILSERRYCGNGFSSLKSAKGIKSFLFLQALGNAARILLGPGPLFLWAWL